MPGRAFEKAYVNESLNKLNVLLLVLFSPIKRVGYY
jgi:hypothetical protein